METIEDAVIELQAQVSTLSTLLRAMLMTHPQPQAVKAAWDQLVTPKLAANLQRSMERPDRDQIRESVEYWIRHWTDRLAAAMRGRELHDE